MTVISSPMVQERQNSADSLLAERLWDAIFLARAGNDQPAAAELEDTARRFYQPMARSVAGVVCGESVLETDNAEQFADIALARAIQGWRHRTSSGFRRFARSEIIRQLSTR